ncbi:MAG TPA: hypothetical protein VN028_04325 [Rhodocyclaceae bacterium]|nr:hypothetical protein [Rhodocyclaceae bacterium]
MRTSSILLLALFVCSGLARADDLTLSGFGTLGYSHDNRERMGFVRNTTQPASEDRNGTFLSDSVLGLQLNYTPSPQFEAVVQAVARDKQNTSLGNSLEWAFLAWHPNEAVDLRVGRMGPDIFLLSDYRNLGFAQPWVRPPTEFYGWIPLFSVNGIDAAYNFDAGDTRWRIKTQLGNSNTDIPLDASHAFNFKAKNIRNLTLQAEHGPWQFKAGYSIFTAGSNPGTLAPIANGLTSVAGASPIPAITAEANALNADLQVSGATVRYRSVGAAYDDGTWLLQGEAARIGSDSRLMPAGDTAYVTLGRRIGSFTPYVGLARFKPERDAVTGTNDWSLLGTDAVSAQTAAVAAYNNFRIDQRTVTLGLRWDFDSRTALKLQWDRSRVGARGYGLWQVNNLVDGTASQHVDLISVSLDFVF